MRDIAVEKLDRYNDGSAYAALGGGVYQHLADHSATPYRLALSFTAEEGEGQYPLEDVLDEYLLHVTDEFGSAGGPWAAGQRITIEFGGELDAVQKATGLAGKRVYNHHFTEGGRKYVRTVTE